jgi:tRNA(Ile2) C34 agmatinyltransferase TiaS
MFDELIEDVINNDGCQTCGGDLRYLGALGTRLHFRCRNCGIDHNVSAESDHAVRDAERRFGC